MRTFNSLSMLLASSLQDYLWLVILLCVLIAVALAVLIVLLVWHKRKAETAPEEPASEPKKEPEPKQEPELKKEPEPKTKPEPVKEPEPKREAKPSPAPRGGESELAAALAVPVPAEDAVAAPAVVVRRRLVYVRYDRSFLARLIQSDDAVKAYYSELKNKLLSYGVKSRLSWKAESFRYRGELLVRMKIRGKRLCVYYALDPARFAETKYKVEDGSDVRSNEGVPCLYRILNDRRLRYAKDLIDLLMAERGVPSVSGGEEDYAARYPYEEIGPLLLRKLAKRIEYTEEEAAGENTVANAEDKFVREEYRIEGGAVQAEQAHTLMRDEVAEELVEEGVLYADKTKTGIINVDTLGEYFESGEEVTLEKIKERMPFFNRKVTYLKVLARGRLAEPLIVTADDFSPDAVKMIVLTGGRVIRTKRR